MGILVFVGVVFAIWVTLDMMITQKDLESRSWDRIPDRKKRKD